MRTAPLVLIDLQTEEGILAEPIQMKDGHALTPDRPGSDLEWDEGAIARVLT